MVSLFTSKDFYETIDISFGIFFAQIYSTFTIQKKNCYGNKKTEHTSCNKNLIMKPYCQPTSEPKTKK